MNITKIIIVFVIAVIAVADVALLAFGGYERTISWTFYTESHKYPIIPFAIGVVCGHLFWENRAAKEDRKP